MRVLLDTQAWLWMVGAPERLSPEARKLLEDPESELLLSAASTWEIAIKWAIGKLELPGDPADVIPDWMARSAVTAVAVEHSHALRVAGLLMHHADPFDRLLVAQAQLEDVPVLTSDQAFDDYEVQRIRA